MSNDSILDTVLALLTRELGSDLAGVLAGGSRLRGEGDAHSDIDVVVVIASNRRRRWNVVVDGVEIEMFLNPPAQMRLYFEQDRVSGRGVMPHLCSTGRIVFDPQGIMAALRDEAAAVWAAGPAPLSATERWQLRYLPADYLRDIADVSAIDAERAAYLIGLLLPQLVNGHYRIAGRWLHKPKRVLDDLASWDAAAARTARQVCAPSAAVGDRLTALTGFAEHVLRPLGGLMPLAWGTEWEPLQLQG